MLKTKYFQLKNIVPRTCLIITKYFHRKQIECLISTCYLHIKHRNRATHVNYFNILYTYTIIQISYIY